MRTSLMFVPFGWATFSPGCILTPSQCSVHAERWIETGNRGAHVRSFTPSTLGKSAFRFPLERFGAVTKGQQVPST
jgi:hypothetical protein